MLSRIFLVDRTWQERFGAPRAMARFHEGIAENHAWKQRNGATIWGDKIPP